MSKAKADTGTSCGQKTRVREECREPCTTEARICRDWSVQLQGWSRREPLMFSRDTLSRPTWGMCAHYAPPLLNRRNYQPTRSWRWWWWRCSLATPKSMRLKPIEPRTSATAPCCPCWRFLKRVKRFMFRFTGGKFSRSGKHRHSRNFRHFEMDERR